MSVFLSTLHIHVDDPEAARGFHRDILTLTAGSGVSNDAAVRDPMGKLVRIEKA